MRRIVHGLPITPKGLLAELRGGSFCVSYEDRRQIEAAIELVGEDQILLLDNGAFTAWKQGRPVTDWSGFYEWADDIMDRCPHAVAVIPDVIGGTEEENLALVAQAVRRLKHPERAMPVWHMNESLGQLKTFCRIFNFVAWGSCAEYDVSKPEAFLVRARHAIALMDWVKIGYGNRPWLHLMRGLALMPRVGCDSADSTNIARNHHRRKGELAHVRQMADRIAAKIRGLALEPLPLFATLEETNGLLQTS